MMQPFKSIKALSQTCSCLAFYSANKQSMNYKLIHALFSEFAENNCCAITHGGITGEGYSKGIKLVKVINKQLEENTYQNISSMTFYSVVSKEKDYNDWQLYASAMSLPKTHGCELIICLDRNHNLLGNPALADIIYKINNIFNIDYAIGYERAYDLGPYYYASGIAQGLERNSTEAEKIAHWFRSILNNTFFNKNILRDVYPINILNNKQLQAKLLLKSTFGFHKHITLESWIVKNGFGVLTKITERLWLWEINQEINEIAKELCKNKLLLFCIDESSE